MAADGAAALPSAGKQPILKAGPTGAGLFFGSLCLARRRPGGASRGQSPGLERLAEAASSFLHLLSSGQVVDFAPFQGSARQLHGQG